ncbi:hypothetical protein EON65_49225 [archaeon]|nr:MAG: hypothetical protein EON65_49225 [archaeon]
MSMNAFVALKIIMFIMLWTRYSQGFTRRCGFTLPNRLKTSQSLANKRGALDGRGLPKGSQDELRRYKLEYQQLSGLPDLSRPFKVLGIESSCDDTGVAMVTSDGQVKVVVFDIIIGVNKYAFITNTQL